MKVGTSLTHGSIKEIATQSITAEKNGYDFITTNEAQHNPFFPIITASEHTTKIQLVTSIALAFSRSPMDTAYMAWDLQKMTNGRCILGLGAQVKGHITRRFSMPYSKPAKRMREYILALKTIWNAWQNQEKLDFQGEFYSFDLMPPFFTPEPIENPNIKIYLAAVNPMMLQLAGELCDGVLIHPFNTQKYTDEVIIPNIQLGAEKSDRSENSVEINEGGFIVTGPNDHDIENSKIQTRSQLAFYASTPSYSPIMNLHGWENTAKKLYQMSKTGDWNNMGNEIDDEMLNSFAVIGNYEEIAARIKSRFSDYASSIKFSIPENADDSILRTIIHSIKS